MIQVHILKRYGKRLSKSTQTFLSCNGSMRCLRWEHRPCNLLTQYVQRERKAFAKGDSEVK